MKRIAPWFLSLALIGTALPAEELLRNGGFELPGMDDLSRDFSPKEQEITGWSFSGGGVSLINHTRLLAGEGFQSILLPCTATGSPVLQQQFNLAVAGPVRVSFKLAASKAVDGEIDIGLDGATVKTIRLAEFWKPEEIALTDQMKWRIATTPPLALAAGKHTLSFQVRRFQPRADHQGDTRSSVQGILIDAVSVQAEPFDERVAAGRQHPWPAEAKTQWKSGGILPLDGIAGPWVATRTLACYPSLANFYGAVRSTKEMGGLQNLHFVDEGGADGVLDAITLDGHPVFCDESRWYPYQVQTRAQAGEVDMESTLRMVFANHGVLDRFTFTNTSAKTVSRRLEMNLRSAEVTRPDPFTAIIPGGATRVYHFTVAPDDILTTNGLTVAVWNISLPPQAGREISLGLALAKNAAEAGQNARRWGEHFAEVFASAKSDWENRWRAVFTPGNGIYSGCLPTLETDDQALRELYYLSIASMLETERDNFAEFKQCFVGEDPEWGGDVTWFWDYSLTSLPYALLNPAVMKNELRHWLTIDYRACSHFSLYTGRADGNWYAVNPYAYFISFDRYLTVSGDYAFLSEQVNGRTVLDYLDTLAMDWQRLVPQNGKLADIGGNCWNMLEAPPNYIHTVASINAANLWMMRRMAEYHEKLKHLKRAGDLRARADALVPELLKLYNKKTGSWNVLYPDGRQIDSRHIYDYLTVGTTISGDLAGDVKQGMMDFMDRELMTKTWMRAMSREDPSAFNSDRSDHGPAGSYTGWPAKAAQATAELGRFDKALDMMRRFRTAFDSAIPQAIELTKVEGQEDLQAKVSSRAGASFAEVSGCFAEVIINTFFGFRPEPQGTTALWNPESVRGFKGQLRHICWHGDFYTIMSDKDGLHLTQE
ncbi:MAG TPA: hypothetical protein VG347_06615 [Verrucomicrobiae bacterium]|nr:hypothetical protein [Verrucomicrobiae bacterium]